MFKQRVESNGFAEIVHCWTHYPKEISPRRLGSLAIIGFLTISFVQWLKANPLLKAVFVPVGLILIIVLFIAFSKWVLEKKV